MSEVLDLLSAASAPWMRDAVCAQVGGDEWFPNDRDKGTAARAKRLCQSCPVIDQCLTYAMRVNPREGIWAGLAPKQIAALRAAS